MEGYFVPSVLGEVPLDLRPLAMDDEHVQLELELGCEDVRGGAGGGLLSQRGEFFR